MKINDKIIKSKKIMIRLFNKIKKCNKFINNYKKTYNLYIKKWRFIIIYNIKIYLFSKWNKKFICHKKNLK